MYSPWLALWCIAVAVRSPIASRSHWLTEARTLNVRSEAANQGVVALGFNCGNCCYAMRSHPFGRGGLQATTANREPAPIELGEEAVAALAAEVA